MEARKKQRISRLFEAHGRVKRSTALALKTKGNGLAIVLHGHSGLGETLTAAAECVAAYVKEPLDEVRYVWNNQLSKFEALGISFYHGTHDFITDPKMTGRTWNGSEMRRVIGSAVALARPSEWTEEHGEEERKTGPHIDILELEDAVELAGGFG
ncbi:hypothetical protein PG987_006096 [Apiospora arundinis]